MGFGLTVDIPLLKNWQVNVDSAISQMQNWALSMGAPKIPLVSPYFLEKMLGRRTVRDKERISRSSRREGSRRKSDSHDSRWGGLGSNRREESDNRRHRGYDGVGIRNRSAPYWTGSGRMSENKRVESS